jgi:hypothetical protein
LYDIVREDPDHEPTRTVLGLASRTRSATEDGIRLRRPNSRHPQFGWPARGYWLVESPHFRVETNASRDAARTLVRQLERLHLVWSQLFFDFWSTPEQLRAAMRQRRVFDLPDKRHRVVLFAERTQYTQVLQPYEPQIEITLGIYRHADRTAYFHHELSSSHATRIHEVTHQLFHEIADADDTVGEQANFWIVEGIALYMESLGERNEVVHLGGLDAERLQYARYRALSEGFHVPLRQLALLGRHALQTHEHIRQLYSEAAGITQFLMHQEDGGRAAVIGQLRSVYGVRKASLAPSKSLDVLLDDFDPKYLAFLDVTDDAMWHVDESATKLALGHTSVTDEGLGQIPHVSRMDWIDLSFCRVTDVGVRHLAGASKLNQLSLERTLITDASLAIVAQFTDLRELDLSRTAVTSAGLQKLAGLRKLEALWLTNTAVDDAVLSVLRQFKSLRTLDVQGTSVTPSAVRALRAELPELRID